MKKLSAYIILLLVSVILVLSCRKDPEIKVEGNQIVAPIGPYKTTPYQVALPKGFPTMPNPLNNPMTVEGVNLGRMLFFDSILSGNYKQSCSSCHLQKYAFSDKDHFTGADVKFSTGTDGASLGKMNAPAIFNKAWDREGSNPQGGFFWDGRAATLEDQALKPITNPLEMNIPAIEDAVKRLQASNTYPNLFEKAFGSKTIVKENLGKAIAQYVRTIVSGSSQYDSVKNRIVGGAPDFRTADEKLGFLLFFNDPKFTKDSTKRDQAFDIKDPKLSGVDCGHCHSSPFFTPEQTMNSFLMNGSRVTTDAGADVPVKVPTLRNIALTAPYMHDGRYPNLDSVLNNYDHGLSYTASSNDLSERMFYKFWADKYGNKPKMNLSAKEKKAIIAFLNTLTDNSLGTDPRYKNPFLK